MNRKGFTLIELMIILVVIGILVAVGLPRFTSFIEEGRISATKQEMAALKSASKIYETNMRYMPSAPIDLLNTPTKPGGGNWISGVEVWKGPYMDGAIEDVCTDAWGHPYIIYYSGSNPYGFVLFSYGPDGVPGGTPSDDITDWLRYDGGAAKNANGYHTGPPSTCPADPSGALPTGGGST